LSRSNVARRSPSSGLAPGSSAERARLEVVDRPVRVHAGIVLHAELFHPRQRDRGREREDQEKQPVGGASRGPVSRGRAPLRSSTARPRVARRRPRPARGRTKGAERGEAHRDQGGDHRLHGQRFDGQAETRGGQVLPSEQENPAHDAQKRQSEERGGIGSGPGGPGISCPHSRIHAAKGRSRARRAGGRVRRQGTAR